MIWTEFAGKYVSKEGCENELNEHMGGCDQEWEGESIVIWREHPLVVHGESHSEEEPVSSSGMNDTLVRVLSPTLGMYHVPRPYERQVYERVSPPPPLLLLDGCQVNIVAKGVGVDHVVVVWWSV